MPANRKVPESATFWFQSNRSPAWRLYAHGCSYSRATGRPHGGFMPSGAPTVGLKVARMAAYTFRRRYSRSHELMTRLKASNSSRFTAQ